MKRWIRALAVCFVVLSVLGIGYVFADSNQGAIENEALIDEIWQGLYSFENKFSVKYTGSDVGTAQENIEQFWSRVFREDPLFSNIVERINSVEYSVTEQALVATFELEYKNGYDANGHKAVMAYVKKAAKAARQSSRTDYEVVKKINDKMCRDFHYDETYWNETPYDMIRDKSGVCSAYAALFAMIARECGIPVRVQSGRLAGGNHGWNLVNVGGAWYHLDVTNNDAARSGRYFLKSSKSLARSGFRWEKLEEDISPSDFKKGSSKVNKL